MYVDVFYQQTRTEQPDNHGDAASPVRSQHHAVIKSHLHVASTQYVCVGTHYLVFGQTHVAGAWGAGFLADVSRQ